MEQQQVQPSYSYIQYSYVIMFYSLSDDQMSPWRQEVMQTNLTLMRFGNCWARFSFSIIFLRHKEIEHRKREIESNLLVDTNKSRVIFYSYTCLQPQTETLWIDCRSVTNIGRILETSFSDEEEKERVRRFEFLGAKQV